MSDANFNQAENTQTVAAKEQASALLPRPRVSYMPVESPMGIMDTARFEHIGRVATVMAKAGLMPQTLTHYVDGKDNKGDPIYKDLPFEVVQARAYLIANQADLWHADPMAVAQCTSLVYNRLMYEGKLVHGVISARLGLDLIYEFGVYNPRKRDIDPMPENGLDPDNQALGVRVSGTLPGEDNPRWIAGSVGMWHKGPKSPWGSATAWPRQLRYMGAREWCRAHKPSLMLGILTDDEVDEYDLGRQVAAIAPAGPMLPHAGFEDQRQGQLIEGPKKPRRNKAVEDKMADLHKTQSGANPADVLDGDDLPGDLKARPTETASAQGAEPEQDTSASATDASTASVAETSFPETSSQPTDDGDAPLTDDEKPDVISEGFPEPGEVYHLDGDVWQPNGRRESYRDGKPFSTAGRKAGLRIYDDHAPKVQEEEDDEAGLPPDFTAYINAIEGAPKWVECKAAMATFYKTSTFTQMTPQQQNKVRADTWAAISEKGLPDLPDHAQDVSAFRLWIEWCEDADTITGTLRILEGEDTFSKKEPSFKDAIRKAVAARLEVLGA